MTNFESLAITQLGEVVKQLALINGNLEALRIVKQERGAIASQMEPGQFQTKVAG